MIDDPNPAVTGSDGGNAARVARADSHIPTPRAAGGWTRTSGRATHGVLRARREASGPLRPGGRHRLLVVLGAFVAGALAVAHRRGSH